MGITFKYEYRLTDYTDTVVIEGEFDLEVHCYSIRSPDVKTKGMFKLMEVEREKIHEYKPFKKIEMKVTNVHTGSVRYL